MWQYRKILVWDFVFFVAKMVTLWKKLRKKKFRSYITMCIFFRPTNFIFFSGIYFFFIQKNNFGLLFFGKNWYRVVFSYKSDFLQKKCRVFGFVGRSNPGITFYRKKVTRKFYNVKKSRKKVEDYKKKVEIKSFVLTSPCAFFLALQILFFFLVFIFFLYKKIISGYFFSVKIDTGLYFPTNRISYKKNVGFLGL